MNSGKITILMNKNRILCGGCRKPLMDVKSKTYRDYKRGKYKYCPKCGEKVDMESLVNLCEK